jgi:5-methylcytosine-specific restriction protein A
MGKLSTIKPRIATIDTRRGASAAVERITGGRQRKIRERIMLRDKYTCRICGRVTAHGEVDHIVPLHLGGAEGSDANLQYLCCDCHKVKSKQEEKERTG